MGNLDKLKEIIGMVGKDPYEGMTPQEKKLAKLEGVFKLLDDGVTKEEFEKNLTEILKLMKGMKEQSSSDFLAIKEALRMSLEKLNSTHESLLTDAKNQIDTLFVENKLSAIDAKQNEAIERLYQRLSTLVDGKDGKVGERGEKGDTGKEGENGSPDTPEIIREKLELLRGNDRLDVSAIRGLSERLNKVESNANRPVVVGGGSSGGGHIVKSYDLSASLNGVLTTFSLPAFWRVISVHLSSMPVLRETTDWTQNGSASTISFTSQVDAATYLASGQSLVVIYSE